MRDHTLIIAGATGYGVWPDNSLEGARACLLAPVDGIEIDVQLTADDIVVAHHDERLSPSSTRLDGQWLDGPSAAIKQIRYEELRRYDVGRWKAGSSRFARYPKRLQIDNVRIPTLRDLLSLLNAAPGPKRRLYVEVKTDPKHPIDDAQALTDAVLNEIALAHYGAHTKIIAFDWSVLRLARAKNATIATAHLTIPRELSHQVQHLASGYSPWTDDFDPKRFGGSVFGAIKAHGGEEWSPHFGEVNEAAVDDAKTVGLKVGPWGLSQTSDIQRMVKLGVFSATVSGPAWD